LLNAPAHTSQHAREALFGAHYDPQLQQEDEQQLKVCVARFFKDGVVAGWLGQTQRARLLP
jgi:hypothetical protein